MSYQARVYRIFVATPSDVLKERNAIRSAILDWNTFYSFDTKIVLEPVLWETHAVPEMGSEPQLIINKQLVNECDLLVGVFWTRLGTPTPRAQSGTVEEIDEFIKAKKSVILYFSNCPVNPDKIDKSQYEKLKKYKKYCRTNGLIYSYKSLEDFKQKFRNHLSKLMNRIQENKENDEKISMDDTALAERLKPPYLWVKKTDKYDNWDSLMDSYSDKKYLGNLFIGDGNNSATSKPNTDDNTVLLYGPSMSGKFTIARAIAKKLGWDYLKVSPDICVTGDRRDIGLITDMLFENLNKRKNLVIYFDKLDKLIDNPGYKEAGTSTWVTSLLPEKLKELKKNKNIILVMSADNIDKIDPIISDIMDYVLPVGSICWRDRLIKLKDTLLSDDLANKKELKHILQNYPDIRDMVNELNGYKDVCAMDRGDVKNRYVKNFLLATNYITLYDLTDIFFKLREGNEAQMLDKFNAFFIGDEFVNRENYDYRRLGHTYKDRFRLPENLRSGQADESNKNNDMCIYKPVVQWTPL